MTDRQIISTTGQRSADPPSASGAEVAVVAVTGLIAIAGAVFQVATPGTPAAHYETVGDYARELGFLAYLLGSIASLVIAKRADIGTRASRGLIATGYGLVAVGVGAGLVLRDDPDWFFLLGGPGNLLAVVGFVILAVSGWRRAILPAWAALLCGVGGLVAVLLSEFGTSVLIGAFWIYVASALRGSGSR